MAQVYTGEDGSGNGLAIGDETVTRSACTLGSAAVPTVTQGLILSYFNAKKLQAPTQVRVVTGGTAAGATPTLCRIGLYLVSTINGILTGTLVASTANDTTLFAAANTQYTKSWIAAPTMQPGQRYALATLVVSAAALPTFVGQQFNSTVESSMPPRMGATLTGQADLPASFVDTALSQWGWQQYGVILP